MASVAVLCSFIAGGSQQEILDVFCVGGESSIGYFAIEFVMEDLVGLQDVPRASAVDGEWD